MSAWKRIALAVLSLLGAGFAPIGATAPPTVTSATPASAYTGTTALDVVVTGSNFDRTAKVQYLVSGTTDTGGIAVIKVAYRSSSQLVTTIAIAGTADLSRFDIVVTLSDGRKGKGTTLFMVQAPPTYPANRAWHSFTSNGRSDVAGSRLYMYGGAGSDWQAVPADFWYYRSYYDQWSLVSPVSATRPGKRQLTGLSCGAGACVMAGGSNGGGLLVDETWVYGEATNAWSQAKCARTSPCPSARQLTAMAFDPQQGNHLLFGGRGSQSPGLNDTWTFDAATLKWTLRAPTFKPAERNSAAALNVPGIGVVMHGGQDYYGRAAYCDMYVWNGSNWRQVQFDVNQPHPCLHSQSMAWDGRDLVVTGGYVDTSDTPSAVLWRFTFAADAKSGVWSQASSGVCQPTDGTDASIHPGSRMAYDIPTATRVHFGGEMNSDGGVIRYGNTVECY